MVFLAGLPLGPYLPTSSVTSSAERLEMNICYASGAGSYLRDSLAVLPAEEDSPGDATGVLALEEKRLGFAILETEGLAVATDEELTLQSRTER